MPFLLTGLACRVVLKGDAGTGEIGVPAQGIRVINDVDGERPELTGTKAL